MYEFLDRTVTSLDKADRFLIWSMRTWVKSLGQDQCPASVVAPAFARWHMIGGLQPFHRSMLILNRNALEKIAFCSLQCNHVSEHEAILLSLVHALANGKPVQAKDVLTLLVDEDGVGDALESLNSLAHAMRNASLFVSEPPKSAHPQSRRDT